MPVRPVVPFLMISADVNQVRGSWRLRGWICFASIRRAAEASSPGSDRGVEGQRAEREQTSKVAEKLEEDD